MLHAVGEARFFGFSQLMQTHGFNAGQLPIGFMMERHFQNRHREAFEQLARYVGQFRLFRLTKVNAPPEAFGISRQTVQHFTDARLQNSVHSRLGEIGESLYRGNHLMATCLG